MQLTLPAWYRLVDRPLEQPYSGPHDAPIRTPMAQVVLVGTYYVAGAAVSSGPY